MTQATQPIYKDNPGDLPASYTLPAGLDLTVQSVVARIDGSGAAGSFYPALSVYTSDGLLMARVRADTLYAAGDTGVVTWSPFLRQQAATPTPGTTLNAIHAFKNTALSVGSDNDKQIKFDAVSSFDTTVFGTTVSAGKVTRIKLLVAGWYAVFGNLVWDTSWTGNQSMYVISVSSAEGSFGMSSPREDGAHTSVFPILAYTRQYPVATVEGLAETPPTLLEFWVNQDSGAARQLDTCLVEVLYLGASDFS